MFPRKLISGFALLSLGLLLIFFTGCSSGGNNPTANTANTNANAPTRPAATNSAPQTKININTASEADLLRAIPNLGNRMVHEFEEYRPYKSIFQFRKEIGKYVDQAQVAEYEKYIFVPIDVNQSDAPTLQQIPGLDANEAQELIAGRPYASPDAFLAKLADKISAAELNIAKTYLAQT
jgi:DNA uptake protein ComE-like DNA-binding protein